MLRITRSDRPTNRVSLQVEGRIVGEDVRILDRECRSLLGTGSALHLDLAGVRFVDRAGVAVLRALRREGLEIERCSPLLQEILDDGDPR